MKNDKPASGRLEVPRRYSGKTLEAPIRGARLPAFPPSILGAMTPPPRSVQMPTQMPVQERTTRTAPQGQRRERAETRSSASAPPSRVTNRGTRASPRPSVPPSVPSSPQHPRQEEPQWLDMMQSELEDLNRRIERGDLSGIADDNALVIGLAWGFGIVAVLIGLMMGTIVWLVLAGAAWGLSTMIGKASTQTTQYSGGAIDMVKSAQKVLSHLHPAWANADTLKLHLRILAIICGAIWVLTQLGLGIGG